MNNNSSITVKQRAKEIFDKYFVILPLEASFSDTAEIANQKCVDHYNLALTCAIQSVDNILNFMITDLNWSQNGNIDLWQEVKQELEKLK